jgi:hypothetical protein
VYKNGAFLKGKIGMHIHNSKGPAPSKDPHKSSNTILFALIPSELIALPWR